MAAYTMGTPLVSLCYAAIVMALLKGGNMETLFWTILVFDVLFITIFDLLTTFKYLFCTRPKRKKYNCRNWHCRKFALCEYSQGYREDLCS